jgi:molybdopterin-guanine dinucleotide biosynthesis protein A
MGADKAALAFEGEPLGARVSRRMAEACREVLVASGDGERLAWLGLPQVADDPPGVGPLGGIVAGLGRATHPLVAVVAVDMPFASAAVLRLLAAAWDGESALVPVTPEGPQPLHAVYAKRAAPALRDYLATGRAVRAAVTAIGGRLVGANEWSPADPSGRFALNLNRPEDIRELSRPPEPG